MHPKWLLPLELIVEKPLAVGSVHLLIPVLQGIDPREIDLKEPALKTLVLKVLYASLCRRGYPSGLRAFLALAPKFWTGENRLELP